MRFLERFEPQIYAVTRFVVGALFMCHGAQKLLGAFGGSPAAGKPPLILVGGVIELVGGLLIAIGLFAGVAAFLASGMMAVAYFTVHFKNGFWPIQNQGELAVVYCFLFLYVAAHGSGAYSVDELRHGKPSMRLPWATRRAY